MNVEKFFEEFGNVCRSNDLTSIERCLTKNIEQAEQEHDDASLVTILNEAAGFYRNVSRHPQAISLADKALELLRKMGMQHSVPYGTTLLNAATAYRAAGQSDKAMEMFTESLKLLSALLPSDDYRIAALHNNISDTYAERGDIVRAMESLTKAAVIMEQKPEMAGDCAIIFTNLGQLYLQRERMPDALAALDKAEELFRTAIGGKMESLPGQYAALLACRAEAYFKAKDYEKAVSAFTAAMEHINNTLGKNTNYAITCQNCAEAYAALGQHDKAAELHAEAASILQHIAAQQ